VEVGLQIASVAYGALLGVFLLGVLTKRTNQPGAIIGMICGLATELYLWKWSHVAFTWWVAIGTCVTFIVGYFASCLMKGYDSSQTPRGAKRNRRGRLFNRKDRKNKALLSDLCDLFAPFAFKISRSQRPCP
jgi:Na+/proline symporter